MDQKKVQKNLRWAEKRLGRKIERDPNTGRLILYHGELDQLAAGPSLRQLLALFAVCALLGFALAELFKYVAK